MTTIGAYRCVFRSRSRRVSACSRSRRRREPARQADARPAAKSKPEVEPKSAAKHRRQGQSAPAPAPGGGQPTLLGQFGDWGAYTATSGGKKVCYALAKPSSQATDPPNRPRDPAYMFISTRPAENVRNEIRSSIGYPFKPGYEATVDIGSAKYAMYTQDDGAWVKNAAEEARMVDAMRQGRRHGGGRRIRPRHQIDRPLYAQGPGPGARPRRAGVQIGASVRHAAAEPGTIRKSPDLAI